ncbi:MAG: bifunctional adenosylcobinamide kinase/adenosylcobinamide-phosphate guanylyltransferase [Actinobacteria bacterium]|nr:bifunctional adenosylcobinamide kinase/adenosylcobinamide-phosphate guanylyltransferase [Actinomycetota bacterium]
MGYIYFLLGGARSGKSSYAEELAKQLAENIAYIATAEIIDEEMQKRIEVHKSRRPATWTTFEFESSTPELKDYEEVLKNIAQKKYEVVLIDCITILLFRLIHKYRLDELEIIKNSLEKKIEDEVTIFFKEFLELTKKSRLKFVIVSNEVGMGLVPPYPLGRIFRDLMGAVNKQIAAVSDEAYFFIAGLRKKLKE